MSEAQPDANGWYKVSEVPIPRLGLHGAWDRLVESPKLWYWLKKQNNPSAGAVITHWQWRKAGNPPLPPVDG